MTYVYAPISSDLWITYLRVLEIERLGRVDEPPFLSDAAAPVQYTLPLAAAAFAPVRRKTLTTVQKLSGESMMFNRISTLLVLNFHLCIAGCDGPPQQDGACRHRYQFWR